MSTQQLGVPEKDASSNAVISICAAESVVVLDTRFLRSARGRALIAPHADGDLLGLR